MTMRECYEAIGGNYEDAFRGAHTLKGVCQNLSFDRLYEASNELTELLRDRIGEKPGIPDGNGKSNRSI